MAKRKQNVPPQNESATDESGPVTACAKCGSTNREPYNPAFQREVEQGGIHDGQPYTHVRFDNTRCLACGQHRCDRSYVSLAPAE